MSDTPSLAALVENAKLALRCLYIAQVDVSVARDVEGQVLSAIEAVQAENAALRERVAALETPDSLMDPRGECTYHADDLFALADELELSPGECRRVLAFKDLPDRWLACVVVTRDDEGDPDDTELRLFASETEARAATAPTPGGEHE